MKAWASTCPFFERLALFAACILGLLLALPPLRAAERDPHQMPRNPNSAKECAICHYRWVDTFFLDGRGTDLAPLQTEQVVGTAEMCFSCHDGSVMDSRWAFAPEHGHRSGVPPPENMIRPEVLPLDGRGNMRCVTCHSPHGVPSALGETVSTFLRVNNTNSAMCLICHPTFAGNLAGANHPLGQVTNTVPRELWTRHSDPATAGNLITCETCHVAHGDPKERLLVQPVSDSMLCLTCHPDKSPVNPDGTRNLLHVVNVTPKSAIIPANLITNGAKLGKDGAITCLTCHKVHQNSIEKHLLVARTDAQSSFCFNCHPDKKGMIELKHNLANTFPDARNLAGKSVAESGPCSACHLPHQNARSRPEGGDPFASLCLSCHGLTGLATKTNLVGQSHPMNVPLPNTRSPTGAVTQISLPLYDGLRSISAKGNVTCLTCHDPHLAPLEGTPPAPNKFLRKTLYALCEECHPGRINVLNTKHDLRAAAPAIRNVLGQTPAESGSCGTCHLIHSPNDSTWARPGTNAVHSADKCHSCHQPGGVAEKKIAGNHSHPMDISPAQAGLNTSLPLCPDLSRTNAPGRMTCITCHDPHRWAPAGDAPPDHLAEGTAGNSFLRLPAAPSPALCADCHPKEAAVARTEHDLSLFFPDNTNLLGQCAADTGPCGACHVAHNAPIASKLWARELTRPLPDTSLGDMMCQSCHSGQAVAGNKIPAYSYHPPITLVNLPTTHGQARTSFPLFDPVSGKPAHTGVITCSSCHNIHQWSVKSPDHGPGINLEGDSNDSFLRHRSADLPCKICHGLDALYRYQYYHKSTTHRAQSGSEPPTLAPGAIR